MPDWGDLLDVKTVREELGVSQAELAVLLGVSPRTVQSCEQGWRKPSSALERSILLLLMAWRQGDRFGSEVCWETIDCSQDLRQRCFVYRSRQGHLCWFLSGNACRGLRLRNWQDKKKMCGECAFFWRLLGTKMPAADSE